MSRTASGSTASRIAAMALVSGMLLLGGRVPAASEISYPWKEAFIGALDGSNWCGLVLAPRKDAAFAFRFLAEKDGQTADGRDFVYLVSDLGPNAPDGLYSRVGFDMSLPILSERKNETPILIKPGKRSDLLLLEWSRQGEGAVVGRLIVPKNVTIRLIPYFPWDFKGKYWPAADGEIWGESAGAKPMAGVLWTQRPGTPVTAGGAAEGALSFSTDGERNIYFVAGVGDDPKTVGKRIYRYKNPRTIDQLLEEERDRYEKKRVVVEGLYEGASQAIANTLHWMMLYQPGGHRLYAPPGRFESGDRPAGGEDWLVAGWESFFSGLLLSVESARYASEAVRTALLTQYPNGNVPGWRSRSEGSADRSQPPVGAFTLLKLFGKTGDRDLLAFAYPYLRRWHGFWKAKKSDGRARRDGNGDGLLEWGSDRELLPEKSAGLDGELSAERRAKEESGENDLPNWDDVPIHPETGTQTLNAVDLNSLYALDAWCLSQIADVLDRTADRDAYLAEYEAMRTLINDQLWNSREGFYFDRFWDGRFSTRKSAANFFPLIARIPDDRRAQLLRKHLLNPKEFWGDFSAPTISRDDPAFQDPANPSRQTWRGAVSPPVNYLIYQGLKAYGFDAEASEFAKKSASLFLRAWTNFQLSPENYHPLSGEAAGRRFRSWGPLCALLAVEEYLDFSPWEGFRFGLINPEERGALSRISIQGRRYDLSVAPREMILKEEERPIVTVDGGAVVRHFLYAENEVSFDIQAMSERRIRIDFLRKGKYQLLIDNAPKRVFSAGKIKFDVPEGHHSILLQLLETLN